MSTAMEYLLPNPPDAQVSTLSFSPNKANANRLLVSSWDRTVRLYHLPLSADVQNVEGATSQTRLIHTFEHEAAVLDVCWMSDSLAASACMDRRVRLLNLQTGQSQIIGKHEAAVSRIRFSAKDDILITASWDATLKVWDTKGQTPILATTITLPDKALAMDVTPSSSNDGNNITSRLVVGMAGRAIYVFDLQRWRRQIDRGHDNKDGEEDPWKAEQRRESSLKFMLRDVRCMPSGLGFALSSVEGRIAVEFFEPSSDANLQKYAFKCHRQAEDGTDTVYPVNAIAFHPVYGTFASIGGDATWAVWDPTAKKRIRQYAKMPSGLSAAAISSDGQLQAVASGFDGFLDEGLDAASHSVDQVKGTPSQPIVAQIHVRTGALEECRPRTKAAP